MGDNHCSASRGRVPCQTTSFEEDLRESVVVYGVVEEQFIFLFLDGPLDNDRQLTYHSLQAGADNSRVNNGNSVTTLRLTCFDD